MFKWTLHVSESRRVAAQEVYNTCTLYANLSNKKQPKKEEVKRKRAVASQAESVKHKDMKTDHTLKAKKVQ